jgi:phosphoglycerol transferase
MREPGPLSRPPAATTLLVAMLAVFVYMVLRNGGQYASVFSDEWSYSSFSRLMPFSETPVPSYLYYTVYRLSSSCGDGFLECARVLNALFFVAAMPFIYLLARQHMTRGTALLVALLAIAAPNNTYTSYFMPEAMYFFGFWAFSWSAVREGGAATLPKVALSASLLGLLAMVKVHALFLLPAYLAYLVYCAFAARAVEHPWWRRALLKVAVALVTAAAVRMAVGYLYAGSNGLYLFGTLYANQAQTRPGLDVLAGMALLNLRGHLMALALMFSMPLAAAALQAISRRQRGAAGAASSRLLAWSALMLPSLVVVTAVFTGLVAGSGSESGARLHMRYYDFALPLLLMLAGAALAPTAPAAAPPGWRRRLLVAVPLMVIMVAASQILIPAYTPNHIDSPALFGFTHDRGWYRALMWLSLASVLLWTAHARHGARLFLYLCAPLGLVVAAGHVNLYAGMAQRPDDYVKAGLYAHQYLRPQEADRLTIVGADIANLFKTRFFVDNRKAELVKLAPGEPVTAASLKYPNGWLLVVGGHALPPGAVAHSGARGYVLARVKPLAEAGLHRFTDDEDESLRSTGLSGIEPWGRWSDGALVTLTWDQPLPRKVRLRLDAAAYGPNAELPFTLTAGATVVPLRVGDSHRWQELRFDTDGTVRTIEIRVPRPTSPQELGRAPDARKLGIGLYSLEVLDADAPKPKVLADGDGAQLVR